MFSLNATLPVFLVIVLGWFLMQKKMFNENFVDIINKFVFKVSLPVLLFKDHCHHTDQRCFRPEICHFLYGWHHHHVYGHLGIDKHLYEGQVYGGRFHPGLRPGSAAVLGIAFVQNIYGNSGMTR